MTDQNPHDGFSPRDAVRSESSGNAPVPTDAEDAHGGYADRAARQDTGPAAALARAEEHSAHSVPAAAHANAGTGSHDRTRDADGPQYGVGPFSVREVALLGVWVVAFFVSFFRTNILDSPSGVLVGGANVWLSGLWWILAIALPTVAVGLIVLRRLSPQGIRRVGSLGIDQFASVAFAVSALVWISWIWDTVAVFTETGIWTRSWVIWVEGVVLLAGVVLTVFAPFIPPFSLDFRDREEVPAHRNARPIRPVVARPRTPRAPRPAAAAAPVDTAPDAPAPGSYTGSTDLAHDAAPSTSVLPAHGDQNETDVFAPLRADADGDARSDAEAHDDHSRWAEPAREDASGEHERAAHGDHAHAQAFWALAPEEREIVDDYSTPIFRIGPTAWALVIEDRGETFVVCHDDGRIGYLHDVSGVTRG